MGTNLVILTAQSNSYHQFLLALPVKATTGVPSGMKSSRRSQRSREPRSHLPGHPRSQTYWYTFGDQTASTTPLIWPRLSPQTLACTVLIHTPFELDAILSNKVESDDQICDAPLSLSLSLFARACSTSRSRESASGRWENSIQRVRCEPGHSRSP